MTTAKSIRPSRSTTFGQGILLLVGTLLILNGAWLYFGATSPGVFESDTGVTLSELRTSFPNVTTELLMRGRIISLLQIGFGLLLLAASLPRYSRTGVAATVLVLMVALTWLFAASGKPEIAWYYLVYVLLSGSALVLVARR